MSKVLKITCDRCGESVHNLTAFSYGMDIDVFIGDLEREHDSEVHYDLCYICHKRFKDFLKTRGEIIEREKYDQLNKLYEDLLVEKAGGVRANDKRVR